jgi:hypothetical protein
MEVIMRWLPIGLLLLGCAMPTGEGDGPEPGMAELTFVNGLGWFNITDIYYRLVEDPKYPNYPESFWRWHWGYGEEPLAPDESISFEVEPGLYDIRCVSWSRHPGDDGEHVYSRYDVEIPAEGYTWTVVRDDEDE